MISKERLMELIEQKAKIYSTHWKEEVDLSLPCEIEYDGVGREFLLVQEDKDHRPSYWLQNLTEDIEGAKWEEEFGCIERTERLELPTWEEFIEMGTTRFISKVGIDMELAVWYDSTTDFDKKSIKITNTNDYKVRWFDKPLTKENYIIACRKCKELFLGQGEPNE